MTKQLLFAQKRRTITPEKHMQLKRSLLTARRQHARLLRTVRDQGATPGRIYKLKQIEHRISALEWEMACSEVISPVDPITLHEVWNECRPIMHRLWTVVVAWTASIQLYCMSRWQLHQRHHKHVTYS